MKNDRESPINYGNESGFSLVELAIVLLIIGLIIGGILKGQELLESARLKSILTQVNDYRVQTSIFLEKYGYLPGDFDKAEEFIDNTLKNGNGNGIIDGDGLAVDSEAFQFWAHLAKAQLIPEPGEKLNDKEGDFGHGVPKTRMGGGFTVQYGGFGLAKHWFVIGNKNGTQGDGALLTPLQAYGLAHKIGGGNANDGYIRALNDKSATSGTCTTGGKYNIKTMQQNKEKVTEPACVIYFMM